MRQIAARLAVAAVAAALSAAPAGAAPSEPGTVGAEEVLRLTAGGGGAAVVDTRTPQECWEARIPGALCIPPEALKAQAARLPKDRKTPVVFYCRGLG